MSALRYAQAWMAEKLHRSDSGQTATEYVLVILGVVLFLVFAAFALNGMPSRPGSARSALRRLPSRQEPGGHAISPDYYYGCEW